MVSLEGVLFYLLLIDSFGCNIVSWFFPNWYKKRFKKVSKHFPATKGWSISYLLLVLWVGYGLLRLGSLG